MKETIKIGNQIYFVKEGKKIDYLYDDKNNFCGVKKDNVVVEALEVKDHAYITWGVYNIKKYVNGKCVDILEEVCFKDKEILKDFLRGSIYFNMDLDLRVEFSNSIDFIKRKYREYVDLYNIYKREINVSYMQSMLKEALSYIDVLNGIYEGNITKNININDLSLINRDINDYVRILDNICYDCILDVVDSYIDMDNNEALTIKDMIKNKESVVKVTSVLDNWLKEQEKIEDDLFVFEEENEDKFEDIKEDVDNGLDDDFLDIATIDVDETLSEEDNSLEYLRKVESAREKLKELRVGINDQDYLSKLDKFEELLNMVIEGITLKKENLSEKSFNELNEALYQLERIREKKIHNNNIEEKIKVLGSMALIVNDKELNNYINEVKNNKDVNRSYAYYLQTWLIKAIENDEKNTLKINKDVLENLQIIVIIKYSKVLSGADEEKKNAYRKLLELIRNNDQTKEDFYANIKECINILDSKKIEEKKKKPKKISKSGILDKFAYDYVKYIKDLKGVFYNKDSDGQLKVVAKNELMESDIAYINRKTKIFNLKNRQVENVLISDTDVMGTIVNKLNGITKKFRKLEIEDYENFGSVNLSGIIMFNEALGNKANVNELNELYTDLEMMLKLANEEEIKKRAARYKHKKVKLAIMGLMGMLFVGSSVGKKDSNKVQVVSVDNNIEDRLEHHVEKNYISDELIDSINNSSSEYDDLVDMIPTKKEDLQEQKKVLESLKIGDTINIKSNAGIYNSISDVAHNVNEKTSYYKDSRDRKVQSIVFVDDEGRVFNAMTMEAVEQFRKMGYKEVGVSAMYNNTLEGRFKYDDVIKR